MAEVKKARRHTPRCVYNDRKEVKCTIDVSTVASGECTPIRCSSQVVAYDEVVLHEKMSEMAKDAYVRRANLRLPVLTTLNMAVELDQPAMHALCETRVPVNEEFADANIPIVVFDDETGGPLKMGFIGVLSGCLRSLHKAIGNLAGVFDETGQLTHFEFVETTSSQARSLNKAVGEGDKDPPTQMLVLHEKHWDRYLLVPGGELSNVMLKVAQERDREGHWYSNMETPKEKLMLEAIRDGDWKAARRLFELRSDYEYEGWELERLEEVL